MQRIHQQLLHMCAILSGIVVAQDYKQGQELIVSKDFKANDRYFQGVFEVGRRHKVMNPEKMRGEVSTGEWARGWTCWRRGLCCGIAERLYFFFHI